MAALFALIVLFAAARSSDTFLVAASCALSTEACAFLLSVMACAFFDTSALIAASALSCASLFASIRAPVSVSFLSTTATCWAASFFAAARICSALLFRSSCVSTGATLTLAPALHADLLPE